MNKTAPPEIQLIKLALMDPMPGNREFKSGEGQSLAGLKTSIEEQGIKIPLLLRPHPEKKGRYQIVAGCRRHKAAGMAGLTEAPAIVQEMPDKEAKELRLIENVQREGIHKLEEARGYQDLLDLRDDKGVPVHNIDTIHERIGKSEAYVYGCLKLLRMPDCAQEAFLKGKLNPSVALLICRIPNPKMAYKATLEVLDRYGSGITPEREENALDPERDPMSFRQAKEHIQTKYMIRLKGAKFDQEDETLVPLQFEYVPPGSTTPVVLTGKDVDDFKAREAARKAPPVQGERLCGGKCSDCPFRTGNMKKVAPDLVEANDGSADVCTNTACYQQKVKNTLKREQAKFKEKGQELLTPGQSRRILNYYGDALSATDEYIDLREKVPGSKKTWEEALEGHLPENATPTVARGKKTFLLLDIETAQAAAKKAGIKFEKPEPRRNGYDPEAEKREREKQAKRKAFNQLVLAACTKPMLEGIAKKKPLELLCAYVFSHPGHYLIGWKGKDEPTQKELRAAIEKMSLDELCQHLAVNSLSHIDDWRGTIEDEFKQDCEFYGVDLKAITEQVGKEQKAAEEKEKPKAKAPESKPAEKAEAKK